MDPDSQTTMAGSQATTQEESGNSPALSIHHPAITLNQTKLAHPVTIPSKAAPQKNLKDQSLESRS